MGLGGRGGVDRGAKLLDRALVLSLQMEQIARAPGLERTQLRRAFVRRLAERCRRGKGEKSYPSTGKTFTAYS